MLVVSSREVLRALLGSELEQAGFHSDASKVIVAVSKRVKEETIRHYKVAEEKIRVIYNGVDTAGFKPNPELRAQTRDQLGLSNDDFALLFCGTGFRRKGLAYAVAAVDKVPSAKLIVVGDGKPIPHPRVTYLGRQKDVASYYAATDALILPTLYDPFPNVCMEAMASGLPIIISRVAGPSEVAGNAGIVVENPTDIEELAGAVRRLEDASLRNTMGEAALKIASKFTLDRNMEENLKLYEEILQERHRAAVPKGWK